MTRILVIDDNTTFRDSLAAYLQAEGFAVTVASNGVTGFNLVFDVRPALVIADILMPGLGGTALCRLLKEGSETRTIPVILVTGVAELDTDEAEAAGADAVLRKPMDMPALVERIRTLLAATGG
jgi:DNA-binding response OmpR family regulator